MDCPGLRPLVLRLMTSSLAALLHEEGVRHMGIKAAVPWHHYSEEILKERYAEIFFNKLVLQTFKGQLLDEWKYGLDLIQLIRSSVTLLLRHLVFHSTNTHKQKRSHTRKLFALLLWVS